MVTLQRGQAHATRHCTRVLGVQALEERCAAQSASNKRAAALAPMQSSAAAATHARAARARLPASRLQARATAATRALPRLRPAQAASCRRARAASPPSSALRRALAAAHRFTACPRPPLQRRQPPPRLRHSPWSCSARLRPRPQQSQRRLWHSCAMAPEQAAPYTQTLRLRQTARRTFQHARGRSRAQMRTSKLHVPCACTLSRCRRRALAVLALHQQHNR